MADITFEIDAHDQLISDLQRQIKVANDELAKLTNPQKKIQKEKEIEKLENDYKPK